MAQVLCCVSTYFSQACFMCSLRLHICNIAPEILEFLSSGIKSHNPLGSVQSHFQNLMAAPANVNGQSILYANLHAKGNTFKWNLHVALHT